MPMVRFRLIGSRDDADTVIAALHGINNIEHVEEIDDLMQGMRDDSSSSESVSDSEGQVYYIEVDAPNDQIADTVRGSAEVIANDRDAGIEFVDEF
jgi:vacuolar-type H+-ATPase subunit I/STV1